MKSGWHAVRGRQLAPCHLFPTLCLPPSNLRLPQSSFPCSPTARLHAASTASDLYPLFFWSPPHPPRSLFPNLPATCSSTLPPPPRLTFALSQQAWSLLQPREQSMAPGLCGVGTAATALGWSMCAVLHPPGCSKDGACWHEAKVRRSAAERQKWCRGETGACGEKRGGVSMGQKTAAAPALIATLSWGQTHESCLSFSTALYLNVR